jgi:microcin C transport system substrate-binding protein
LSGIFSAFSKKWFEDTGARLDESTLTPFMGTGAYELESYDINQQIIYKRRDDYWAKDLPFAKGRENFDHIRIEYFADSSAAMEAFKAGEYTFRNENTSRIWATGYDFPAIENGWAVQAELPNGNLAQAQSYVFNLRREKFQDRRVREALGLMFNFEWSNESLFYGIYERVQGFWGNSDLEAVGTPTEGELTVLKPLVDQGLLDASILTNEVQMSPVSGTRQLDRGALRKASALLDDAGWLVGEDGMRRKDGELLTVEILESSPSFDRVHNPYVENLKRLGVDAKLNRVDPAQATDRERNYDFDMTVHSLSQSREPSTGLKQWFGSEAMNESTRNLMGLSDPAVDALIDVIVAAQTKEELRNGVKALDRVLRAELFWVPQWFKDVYTVAYYDQYEFPEVLPETTLGELDFWWFNQDKHDALVAAGALKR